MSHLKEYLLFLFVVALTSCKQNNEVLLVQADRLFSNKEYREAIQVYSQIIKGEASNQLAYFNRGICYFNIDSNAKALADFNQVLLLQPVPENGVSFEYNRNSPVVSYKNKIKVPYVNALFERALTKYYMDSLQSAVEDFKMCLQYRYEPRGECLRWIGIIYLNANYKDVACKYFNQAVQEGNFASLEYIKKYNCR